MTPFVSNVTNILSFIIVLCDVLAVFLLLLLMTPLGKTARGQKIAKFFGENALLLAFVVAAASVASSLFYSNVADFVPCLLCWWSRILLYPQAVILLVALLANDERVRKYCITLSAIGVVVSAYHTSLQFGGADLIPCTTTGVSCEHVYFVTYGYVTIPTMALTAFALILLFMLFKKKKELL
jgi:disulfide bond formation protein DsbB